MERPRLVRCIPQLWWPGPNRANRNFHAGADIMAELWRRQSLQIDINGHLSGRGVLLLEMQALMP